MDDIAKSDRDAVRTRAKQQLTRRAKCAHTASRGTVCNDCYYLAIDPEWLIALLERFEAMVAANDKLLSRMPRSLS